MALTLGTNCGFCATAPTTDPADSNNTASTRSNAIKDTSPGTATKITELGWYCDNTTLDANYDIGVYSDDGTGEPNLLVGVSADNAKGLTSGWKVVSGLNITITPNTSYWIAVQCDSTATTTNLNYNTVGGTHALKTSQTALLNDWAGSNGTGEFLFSIYAVWEAGSTTSRKAGVQAILL